MKIKDLYPTDEEISDITKRVNVAPADRTVAKFAVDNAIGKLLEYIESKQENLYYHSQTRSVQGYAISATDWQTLKEIIKDG